MRRDLKQLQGSPYDLLVVGGGIYGAWIALDAALRGLHVALIDQRDFGHATSSNSQCIIHGGLRYLQQLDFKRMRESIRERRALLRVAPHLVRLLPFLMPIYGGTARTKPVMRLAGVLNDLISRDRNDGLEDPLQQIPPCRILSREECLRFAPSVPADRLAGGFLWYDAQVQNAERLTWSVVRSAVQAGASVANYVRATGLVRHDGNVVGIRAEDALTGERFEIHARLVVNASGPWVSQGWADAAKASRRQQRFVKAMAFLTRPLLPDGLALGLRSPAKSSQSPGLMFFTPWQGRTLIGTAFQPHEGGPDALQATEAEIERWRREIHLTYPAAGLAREDIVEVRVGLLPASAAGGDAADRYQMIDHARTDGLDGLISVVGVKYTTARDVAEKTVGLALAKLGVAPAPSSTAATPVWGGDIGGSETFREAVAGSRWWQVGPATVQRLAADHGSRYTDVLGVLAQSSVWREPVDEGAGVLQGEVVYAVREEMAVRLADVVFRRTGLSLAGAVTPERLQRCAALMSRELGWDALRTEQELDDVRSQALRRSMAAAAPATAFEGVPA